MTKTEKVYEFERLCGDGKGGYYLQSTDNCSNPISIHINRTTAAVITVETLYGIAKMKNGERIKALLIEDRGDHRDGR